MCAGNGVGGREVARGLVAIVAGAVAAPGGAGAGAERDLPWRRSSPLLGAEALIRQAVYMPSHARHHT